MKRQVFIGASVLIGLGTAYGQMRTENGGAAYQFAYAPQVAVNAAGAGGGFSGQVTTGRPFSATEERHSSQVLGDGTHIESSETNRLYRDDRGRTRIERAGGNITISDPVAGFSAELNPSTRMATKRPALKIMRFVGPAGESTAATESQLAKLREELSQAQSQLTPTHPKVMQLRSQISELEKSVNQESQRGPLAISSSSSEEANVRTLPPPLQAEQLKKQMAEAQTGEVRIDVATAEGPVIVRVGQGDNASVESLPSQMINGAMAQGTRTTETIPVGKIGNDRAINVVNERWFSNDLQMLLKSTSSDPRFGNTTYELTNIVQTSPDPTLFEIPADYTIRK